MKRKRLLVVVTITAAVLFGYALAMTVVAFRPSSAPFGSVIAAPAEAPDYASAEEVQKVFRTVAARVLQSVVEIEVTAVADREDPGEGGLPWREFFGNPEDNGNPRRFESQGLGSGVIMERKGNLHYVLTNAHVIGEAEDIVVRLHDGETREASLVGKDDRKDLAMIIFEDDGSMYPPVTVGDSDGLYVGDWVLAVGSPFGYEQSVSSGIVSAMGRRDGPDGNINDFIQTDAAINQGNSGGALVDIRGRLVGINTFITTSNGGSIGLGFSIPVNNVKTAVRQFVETGSVSYGWLGVSIGDPGSVETESLGYEVGEGVLVYQVFRGSPAADAGIRPGDLILELNGEPSGDADLLTYRIGDLVPGENARFVVSRLGDVLRLTAEIGTRGDEEGVRSLHVEAWPGFVAVPLVEDIRERMGFDPGEEGILAADVYPQTPAQLAGLRAGDLIVAVDGSPVASLKEFYELLGNDDDFVWSVLRDGEVLQLSPSGEEENE